ncbi:endolytic transglycosylase MltG [Agromyces bauzanensis]|uniref:Endolytic murein transglycosylase n=1 Tax=Agromyces bauzanensis TaxID=1308924 RepID=A0A917UQ19_9MICO|nr:endolytic transglycosylase MltG [Agromyces bauzanensis]GGJ74230.1 hypothetical protein GCM10011372_10400 [Agromyces bauzanensis]
MTRREVREAEQRAAALLAQQQLEQEQAAAAQSPAAPPPQHYPTPEQPAAARPAGPLDAPRRPVYDRGPVQQQAAEQWAAEQQAAAQQAAEQQAAAQQAAAQQAAEQPPQPQQQWQPEQQLGPSETTFRWQLDDPDPSGQPREQQDPLPWNDELQGWSGDPDDESSGRLSRAERRALKREDYDDERSRRRGPWGCLVGLLIVAALGAGAFVFLQDPINSLIERFTPAEDFEGSGTGELVFMIYEGDTGSDIAENLVDEGVTASYDAFYNLLLAQTPEPEFHPGAYRLAEQMSAQAALDALLDPANKLENTFVIQEGMWAKNALAEAAFVTGIPVEELQAAAANPQVYGLPAEATSIEGFLFPATYTVEPNITADALVKMLVDRSFEALDAAGVAPEDRWRTIVKASLIEREAGLRDDYYKVSRVIENRLNPELFDSGLLQFDSTVHYGIGDDSVVTTTDAERADPANPYNTYVHPGLPPGPIGNPGDLAIDAALHPAEGPWLYFVTVDLDTGETVFSATIDEHDAAVERFLAWLEEHPEYGN